MRPSAGFVRTRLIAAFLVLAGLAWGGATLYSNAWKKQAELNLINRTVSNVFSNMAVKSTLDEVYTDANGDLVADVPEHKGLLANPTELFFSFIASEDSANDAAVWEAATLAIGKKTGLPVSYLRLENPKTQLSALRSGQLHITAFSSGTVPTAVNTAGFTPLCTIGSAPDDNVDKTNTDNANTNGSAKFGYTMQFIVKADSAIKALSDLPKKKIAFVRPRSNSGCKAAMILLWEKHGLQPERDYRWYYTYSHGNSIQAIVNGEADAAPVASDLLARLVAKGEIQADDYRVIYESERFPPVAIGCAHNLPAELQASIKSALLELDWADTKLAAEMGAGQPKVFLSISYKDDWANIRRVDQAASSAHNALR